VDALEQITAAVLYEGYVLWPYRRSARKNQQRWTFGGVYPPAFVGFVGSGDPSRVQCQCLVRGSQPTLDAELRFLHVVHRQPVVAAVDGSLACVDELAGVLAWDEAVERHVGPGDVRISAGEARENVTGGTIIRTWSELHGRYDVALERLREDLWRLTASLENTSGWLGHDRGQAQRHGFMSAHFVLRTTNAAFVSLTDPPRELDATARACENIGLWPVLVENEQTMLASPIILYDYPQIAPESPGLLFDSGEIDQLLILNTLTLTDAEKAEVRATDPRARELLDRAEALGTEQLAQLHGAIRELRVLRPAEEVWPTLSSVDNAPVPTGVVIDGAFVQRGCGVRLHPRGRADVFDMLLEGKLATVESIEQDFDDEVQLAVTIDDDPGRDLGMQRMPGHRFFFSPDEVEPI
jgi:hypothetical protein